MMRALMMGAVMAAAMLAAPANAQDATDLSGTWAFQTNSYGNEQFGVIMSGAATFTATAPNRYDVRLIANELIVQRETSASQLLTARQTCMAENAEGQLTITCQLSEAVAGYEPDNFLLQAGTSADELVGALTSGSSPQVTFTRLR
jgi:uncharacterized protein YaiE (UPF0345 family)